MSWQYVLSSDPQNEITNFIHLSIPHKSAASQQEHAVVGALLENRLSLRGAERASASASNIDTLTYMYLPSQSNFLWWLPSIQFTSPIAISENPSNSPLKVCSEDEGRDDE
jgi:hypothetical protein